MKHVSDGIILSQQKYTTDIICRLGVQACKSVDTPISVSEKLSRHVGDPLSPDDATKYRSTVGALQYLTLTRPDILFAVNKVCEFLSAPTSVHWTAVKWIIWYLRGTTSLGIHIWKSAAFLVSAFSDTYSSVVPMITGRQVVLRSFLDPI